MKELLENFTVPQIILFIVLFAVAIKEVSNFLDWIKEKVKKHDKKSQAEVDKEKENQEHLEEFKQVVDEMKVISKQVKILIESDKDDIKAWITQQHHYYCYQKGWIDDYSLDSIEKRYSHYVEEKGNSYVLDLMQEIRALPKRPANYKGAD